MEVVYILRRLLEKHLEKKQDYDVVLIDLEKHTMEFLKNSCEEF